jgi:cell wall-associated NlpC family hydrolase
MTLEDFIEKWNGKKCDFDGAFGFQCVDLFRQYCVDVRKIPEHTGSCSTTGGAKDLYIDFPKMPLEKKYFNRLPKSKVACIGDVVIWDSTPTNKYGHVAIYLGKLNNKIIVFEQDGFKQDGAKINIRSRENLLGYLRGK